MNHFNSPDARVDRRAGRVFRLLLLMIGVAVMVACRPTTGPEAAVPTLVETSESVAAAPTELPATATTAPTNTAEATDTLPPPTEQPTQPPAPTEAPPGPCPRGGEFMYFREDMEDKIMKYDLEGNLICEWGIERSANSMAVDPQAGIIYAFDRSIEQRRYDFTGAPLGPWAQAGCFDLLNDLRTPMLAKTDPDGNLVLVMAASATAKGLMKCAPDGSLISRGPGLDNIVDLAVDGAGDIWVISVVVDAFSQSTLIHLSGDDWSEQARYEIPGLRGITTAPDGNLWVSQWVEDYVGDHKVLKLDTAGNVLVEVGGEPGEGSGQFNRPTQIATDSAGNVYVATNNWRMVKLDAGGQYLSEWSVEPWLVHDMTIVQE